MEDSKSNYYDISAYINDREYNANKYVMKCFSVTMLIYTIAFVLNILDIFVVDQKIMRSGYIPSLIIYVLLILFMRTRNLSDEKTKFYLLFFVEVVHTIMCVSLTYHVVLVTLIPLLYATMYSSKKAMQYLNVLTVLSTVVTVYGGYYFGLCDANMALLTRGTLESYIVDGIFSLVKVNDNPIYTLTLFFVVPRCLIYIAYSYVFHNLYRLVSGSLEKAKLTAELEKAKEDAEYANKVKSQFLAKMSHEIRTPVNAVIGMNEMILRESKDKEIRKYASDVKESSMTLLGIINEILDSSKIESGIIEIINDKYSMRSLLNELYNTINIRANEKGLKLYFEIDNEIPDALLGDCKRIRQVLTNLLTNAVKYTDKGSVTLKVSATVCGENAKISYSVKDTGIGIKKEDIAKIYDEFQRLDLHRNKNIEGTGLGLNIAKQFVTLMGGELYIDSTYEVGSEFSFTLYQKIIEERPIGEFVPGVKELDTEAISKASFISPQGKVLVVDDNKLNIKVFKSLLKNTMLNIYSAESGRECIEFLRNERVNLVFLDHMMPDMDGIETFRIIRKEELCKNTPVIMLTANAIIGDREKYLEEGFDDFITKPIMIDELEKLIQKHMPPELIETVEQTDDTVDINELPSLDEFDFEYALNILRDEQLLISILKDFANSLEVLEGKLPILYNEGIANKNLFEYRVEVHGLKSSAATVGALLLSKVARLQELAIIEEDYDSIETIHPLLMCQIRKHMERLLSIFPKKEKNVRDSIDCEILDMLEMSLKNGDTDVSDALCIEMKQNKYNEELQKLVDELAMYILQLDEEAAIDSICKIRELLGERR